MFHEFVRARRKLGEESRHLPTTPAADVGFPTTATGIRQLFQVPTANLQWDVFVYGTAIADPSGMFEAVP